MVWRKSRGRPLNAPAAFIHTYQPTVAKEPPSGLKHVGYRLQIHVRDGRVRLFTMNGADWSKRYPRIVEEAARIKVNAIIDAEVVRLDQKGVQISTRCIAASLMRKPSPWLSIFCYWAKIFGTAGAM